MLLSDLRSVQLPVRRPPSGGGVLASGGGTTTRLRLRRRLASQRRVDTAKGGRRRSSSRTSRTGRVGLSGHLRRRERERALTRRRRRRRRRDKVRRERKRRHRQSPLRRDRVATGKSAGSVRAVIGGRSGIVARSGGGVLHPTRRNVHLGWVSEVRRCGRGKVVRLERGGRILTSMRVRRFRRVLRRSLARRSSGRASGSSAELHPAHSVREVFLGRVGRGGARLPERSVHALVRRTTGAGALKRVRVPWLGRRGHGGHKVRVAERRRRRVGRLIRVQVRARFGTRDRFRRGGVHRRRRCRRGQTAETRNSRLVVRDQGSGGRRARCQARVASVRRRRRAVRRRIGDGGRIAAITAIAFVFRSRRACRDWQETRASRSAQRGVGHRGGRGGGRAQLHGGSRRVKVRRVGASSSRGKVLSRGNRVREQREGGA